jgi:hypothetical protein
MSAPTKLPLTPEQAADAEVETYRLSLPLADPVRHELESPSHEDACAHMAPGCPCEPSGGVS